MHRFPMTTVFVTILILICGLLGLAIGWWVIVVFPFVLAAVLLIVAYVAVVRNQSARQ